MSDKSLSDKERALLRAARSEVAAKANRREVVNTAGLAGSAPHRGSTSPALPRRDPAPVSPLDGQTVLGWDHPAAQKLPTTPEDKWARIAALMEAERHEATERRAKARRGLLIFLVCLFLVLLIVGARLITR